MLQQPFSKICGGKTQNMKVLDHVNSSIFQTFPLSRLFLVSDLRHPNVLNCFLTKACGPIVWAAFPAHLSRILSDLSSRRQVMMKSNCTSLSFTHEKLLCGACACFQATDRKTCLRYLNQFSTCSFFIYNVAGKFPLVASMPTDKF
jgi:hypothetical protein